MGADPMYSYRTNEPPLSWVRIFRRADRFYIGAPLPGPLRKSRPAGRPVRRIR
jgi:hypothetical protein